jgi:glucosamine--fructose-6-phosphate aminotransferase (isomerizing)
VCGIVGYTGARPAVPLLISGLERLEYRGYDSAGIAVLSPSGELEIRKAVGKLAQLTAILDGQSPEGHSGIGHTRWATHGRPSDENAHPHTDCQGRVVVVHNGVVENYRELRDWLKVRGHELRSETDTEVLAHLIEIELDGLRQGGNGAEKNASASEPLLLTATRRALRQVTGLYAIAVMDVAEPNLLVGARSRAPLIVGIAEHGNFLASDIPAVLNETRQILRLAEGDFVAITADQVTVVNGLGEVQERRPDTIEWDQSAAEKAGYPHFFLKEVYEQPEALRRTLAGRLLEDRVDVPELAALDLSRVKRIVLTGCGSAYHACMMARYVYESWLRVPVEVDIASELRYRDPIVDDSVLAIAVSQSGETADTLAAFELLGSLGAQRIAVTNVVGSAITFQADAVVYQQSGPEVAVVASKSFTGQVTTLLLVGLSLAARMERLDGSEIADTARYLAELPGRVEVALQTAEATSRIAESYANVTQLLFLGRGIGFPTALEGALKLKEISYIHAEGYAAGELKHGPLALIEPGTLVVVLATRSATFDKLMSNVEEVRARGGRIIAIASEGDERVGDHADEVIYVPETTEELSPVVDVIPMQLLSYYAAVARGCDVDKPRNLAKSVTVE